MDEITDIFQQIPESLKKRQSQKSELQRLFQRQKEHLIIYGKGNLGKEVALGLDHAGYPIQCWIDAHQPTQPGGRVVNLKDAVEYVAPDAVIIVALYDIFTEFPHIKKQLNRMGFQTVISVIDLRVWPELFAHTHIHTTLGWDLLPLKRHVHEVEAAYALMGDSLSRKSFHEILAFMISNPNPSFTLCLSENQYMPSDVYLPIAGERIVDCGAFNGDTMRSFAAHRPPEADNSLRTEEETAWAFYTMVEPDPINVRSCKQSASNDLPEPLRDRVTVIHRAVSDESGIIWLDVRGNTTSHILTGDQGISEGKMRVPVARLDDIINSPVTLLKMDIEGCELRALRGAERLIRENQPVLAVCGYHRQADLWEIPGYLHAILPRHRILLRNYVGMIEYVFYAVPEERTLQPV